VTQLRTQWIFIESCGCPFGVLEGSAARTEEDAWHSFYEVPPAIQEAQTRGVRVEHVPHAAYVQHVYPKMLGSYTCPHTSVGAPR
jgi:hypothetical protein